MWRPAVISPEPNGKGHMLDGRQRWSHTPKLLETSWVDGQGTSRYLKGLPQTWSGGIFIQIRTRYLWLKGRGGRRKLSECRMN